MKNCSIFILFYLVFAGNVHAQNFDVRMLKTINPQYPNAEVWRISSGSIYWTTGGVTLGTLAYGFIANDKNMRQNGYELLTTIGINEGATFLLKSIVRRTRPYEKYPGEIFARSYAKDKSFPSGHTSTAFSTATTLALMYHKWYVTTPAFMWAACVAYSRMYLGKHYPSDVLAGAIIGAGSSFLGHAISLKFYRQKK